MRHLALWAWLGAACATAPRALIVPEGPYGAALAANTRAGTAVHGLDTELIVYATAETPEFVQARRAYLAEAFGTPPEQADARAPDLAQPVDGLAFLLGVNANERAFNDLEQPGSHWAVALEAGGARLTPLEVRRIEQTAAQLGTLYPFFDRQFVPYRVVFPQPPSGRRVLVVSGVEATARLDFSVPR